MCYRLIEKISVSGGIYQYYNVEHHIDLICYRLIENNSVSGGI
jgi:hypothetical protein